MAAGSARRRDARLTPDQVNWIRDAAGRNPVGDRYHYQGRSYSWLARKFGVSKALIAQIVTGRAYR